MITLPFHRLTKSVLCCACASVLLAACGGGGSAGTADTSASATPTSSTAADASVNAASTPATSASAATPAASTTTAASTTAVTGPYGQDASQYTMTFDDEFDNGFNTNVWNDAIWYESSNSTKNYTVENGALKIWPQKDGSGNFFNRTVDTDGKFYQTYGYFEIEAKFPVGKGTWPAFWLFNHDQSTHPEIDILEAYAGGGASSGWSDANFHPTAYASTVWPQGPDAAAAGTKTFTNLGDLSAGFHKYGLKWEPNKLTFYFDGQEVYSLNVSMTQRMYILLDLWYGSASGAADDTTPQGSGNSYQVNYVRAWQFK